MIIVILFGAGSDDGLVEFVPSAPLSRILAEHRSIHKYLAQTQADAQGEGGAAQWEGKLWCMGCI